MACPSPQVIQQFFAGKLPVEEYRALRRHFAGCLDCLRLLPDWGPYAPAGEEMEAFVRAGEEGECLDRFEVAAYAVGALPSFRMADAERHLTTCVRCREAVAAWQRQLAEAGMELPPGRGRLPAEPTPRLRWGVWAGVGAAVVLLIGGALWWTFRPPKVAEEELTMEPGVPNFLPEVRGFRRHPRPTRRATSPTTAPPESTGALSPPSAPAPPAAGSTSLPSGEELPEWEEVLDLLTAGQETRPAEEGVSPPAESTPAGGEATGEAVLTEASEATPSAPATEEPPLDWEALLREPASEAEAGSVETESPSMAEESPSAQELEAETSLLSPLQLTSPTSQEVVTSEPTFSWEPVPDAPAYRVTVYVAGSAEPYWETVVSDTSVAYPADAPPLMPGVTYQWQVDTEPSVGLPSEPREFTVLPAEEP